MSCITPPAPLGIPANNLSLLPAPLIHSESLIFPPNFTPNEIVLFSSQIAGIIHRLLSPWEHQLPKPFPRRCCVSNTKAPLVVKISPKRLTSNIHIAELLTQFSYSLTKLRALSKKEPVQNIVLGCTVLILHGRRYDQTG